MWLQAQTSCHPELAWTGTNQLALWECHQPWISFAASALGIFSLSAGIWLPAIYENHMSSPSFCTSRLPARGSSQALFLCSSGWVSLWHSLKKVCWPTCLTLHSSHALASDTKGEPGSNHLLSCSAASPVQWFLAFNSLFKVPWISCRPPKDGWC